MHRTVNVRRHGNEVCGSQRDKAKIVAYMVRGNSYNDQPGRINPARLQESYIDVFSSSRGAKPRTPRSKAEYDFATVYFRGDYATIAAPKRQNFGGFEKWKEVQKIFYKLQYICELTV